MKAYTSFSTKITPQREPIPWREADMTPNSAGGFVFKTDVWTTFERFLIMGTEGGTYYVREQTLTRENATNAIAAIAADGRRAVDLIVKVSDRGLAYKNDPSLFALALAVSCPSADTRAYALSALPQVARTPTHLFHFATYVQQFRGWGRGLKRAISDWYGTKDLGKIAYQVVKVQQRDGFSNRDLLRLAHPKASDPKRNALYKWITDGYGSFEEDDSPLELPLIVQAFEEAKVADTKTLVGLIDKYNLPREALPTESLKKPEVWDALLRRMPPTAMLRNLGNMSKVGLLSPLSEASKLVSAKLRDAEHLKKERVHPLAVLTAAKVYGLGHGIKGDGTWLPVPAVCDALDDAFYATFDNLVPTGKDFLIAVDMSGSMMGSGFPAWHGDYTKDIAGTPLHPCEAAAALALAIARSERNYYIMGFADKFKDLGITPKMRLGEAVACCLAKTFGKTDCAVPAIWAEQAKVKAHAIVVLTDNETYAGSVHPAQALKSYRQACGLPVKEIVVAMVPKPFSIADPKDPGMLDIAGFSPDVPSIINGYVAGFGEAGVGL